MSKPAARPVPEGYHTLTPMLVCKGALEALDFYKRAFGAEEISRLVGPDGKLMHAALRIGDSVLMFTEECPPMGGFDPLHLGGSPVTIHLSVADADAAFARATGAGAAALMPVQEMFWGARYGVFKDPFGHSWSVATQVKDLSPGEIQAGLAQACAQQQASQAA
jgi:PhnB protein